MSSKATLQSTISLYIKEAEYKAISEACKEATWLRGLYGELYGDYSCTTIYYGSQSAICLAKDSMFHEWTKHIDIWHHYIRDVIAQGDIKVIKINTKHNSEDIMTKPIPTAKFKHCSDLAGISNWVLRGFWTLYVFHFSRWLKVTLLKIGFVAKWSLLDMLWTVFNLVPKKLTTILIELFLFSLPIK